MKVFHQGLILVAVPLLIELLIIGNLWMLLTAADHERIRENNYRQFSAMSCRLMALTYEAPYLIINSLQYNSNSKVINQYHKDIDQIRQLHRDSMNLAFSDPLLSDAAKGIDKSLADFLGMTELIADARKSGSAVSLLTEIPKLQSKFNSSKDAAIERIAVMSKIGTKLTEESEKRILQVRQMESRILGLALLANLVVGFCLLVFYRRQIMQRLGIINANTESLSENKELAPPLRGFDEIAQLDQAFHLMDAQLKEASKRERALFNNASDVICVLDKDDRFVKINPACKRLWLYEQDELLESRLTDIIPESEQEALRQALARAQNSFEPAGFELKIRTKRDVILETLWSTYWSESESALYCVVHDITERKNSERVRKQFLSMISSDLKRPLSSISHNVSSLILTGSGSLSQTAIDKLAVAEKNVGRLLGLVNDLLQFAEMDSGKLEIKKEDCSVSALMKRAIQDVEGVAQKHGVQIEMEQNAPENWFVDPNRIMQVLVNLLSNAIKFSPRAAKVRLCAELSAGMIELKIIDQGRGVPASHKEAIFEKFKQVEAKDGKRQSGTGLGLPICKQIIEEHGGSIGVESEEGKGSCFWFALPVDQATSVKLQALKAQESASILAEKRNAAASSKAQLKLATLPAPSRKGGRLKLWQKGAVLVGVPILFEALFVGVLFLQLHQTDQIRQVELRQRKIAAYAGRLMYGYLNGALFMTLDRNEKNWIAFDESYRDTMKLRRELQLLVSGDADAFKHFQRVEEINRKADSFYRNAETVMKGEYSAEKHMKAFEGRGQLLPLTAGMARRLQRLIDDAEKREFHPELQAEQRARQAAVLLAGIGTNILVSVLLAVFFSKDITSRLTTLADNAKRVTLDQELNPELGGLDEIANLDRAFHATAAALVAARKKERAVFDNSQDLICTLAADGQFSSINPACETLLGYSKEDMLRMKILDITFEDDRDITRRTLLTDYGNSLYKSLENRVMRMDASLIHFLWSASKAASDDCIYCVAHDISSRKELEQLKQEFLAVVSHDLRTPLGSITGIAKLILAGAFGKPDDASVEILQSITNEGDKLLELINDLLDIEKLEAGKMQLELESIPLKDLLEKSIECAGKNRAKSVELSVPESKLIIKADRDRIIQAFTNVVNQAGLRQTDGAAVQVTVEDMSDAVEIDVQFDGTPITENARERLFDRFKEVAVESGAEDQGSGLALPIAKHIVESHGGSIGLRVREDQTANIFWMRLPKSE